MCFCLLMDQVWSADGSIFRSCGHTSPYHGNKLTEGPSQDLAPQKSEKSAICRDIELKFGMWTNFGRLSSKTIIKF